MKIRLRNLFLRNVPQSIWWRLVRAKLGTVGERVTLPREGHYTLNTLHLGNHVTIGTGSYLWAVHSRIVIGNKVITGPEIAILAGDHNISLLGKYLIDVGDDEKRPEDDRDVILEGDNWVGARVVILKGVNVGRGAVIGAGAVVTKSIPAYCIVGGNPARLLRLRGSVDEILNHEEKLYLPDQRLSRQSLMDVEAEVNAARQLHITSRDP